jgi:hypothetical protein
MTFPVGVCGSHPFVDEKWTTIMKTKLMNRTTCGSSGDSEWINEERRCMQSHK